MKDDKMHPSRAQRSTTLRDARPTEPISMPSTHALRGRLGYLVAALVAVPTLMGADGGCSSGGKLPVGTEPVTCTAGACDGKARDESAKICSDGSAVERSVCAPQTDGSCNWDFPACPAASNNCDCGPPAPFPPIQCSDGTFRGSFVCTQHSDGTCQWDALACPATDGGLSNDGATAACTMADCAGQGALDDAKLCPDGTALGRSVCTRNRQGTCGWDFPDCPASAEVSPLGGPCESAKPPARHCAAGLECRGGDLAEGTCVVPGAVACNDGSGAVDCCPGEATSGAACPNVGLDCFTACAGGWRSRRVCAANGQWQGTLSLNACDADGGASPTIADSGADGGLCATYCSSIMRACQGGAAQYPDEASCLAACRYLPVGATGVIGNNTLSCRLEYVQRATTTPNPSCWNAGPFGYGACGDFYEGFCSIAAGASPSDPGGLCSPAGGDDAGAVYGSNADCWLRAAGYPLVNMKTTVQNGMVGLDGGFSANGPSTGDTFDCRAYHLLKALTGGTAQSIECINAGASSPSCSPRDL